MNEDITIAKQLEAERQQAEQALQDKEALLRLVLDNIPQYIFWKDCNSVYLGCNRKWAEWAGIGEPDNVVGKMDGDLPWRARELGWHRKGDRQVIETGQPLLGLVQPQIQADGRQTWWEINRLPIHDRQGQVVGILGTIEDITERKRSEAALQEAEERYRGIFENAMEGIYQSTVDGRFVIANPTLAKILGYSSPEELMSSITQIGQQVYVDAQRRAEFVQLMQQHDAVRGFESEVYRKDGTTAWISENVQVIYDAQGQVSGYEGTVQNITLKKRAEQIRKLAQREALFNRLSNQIRSSLDLNTILQTAVNEIRELLQVDRCTFCWYRFRPPSLDFICESRHVDLTSILGSYAIDLNHPEDRHHPVVICALNLEPYHINNAMDSGVHPAVRQAVQNAGHQAELLLPIQTRSGRIGVVCAHHRQPRTWSEDEVELLQAIASQCAIAIEQAELYEQSQLNAVQAQAQAQQLKHALQELQKTQSQLIQTEKMSSLGQLVAGVAHEINNPINFIYGNLAHARSYVDDVLKILALYQATYNPPTPELQAQLQQADLGFLMEDLPKIFVSMETGAERIRRIVLSLRSFSRQDQSDRKLVDVHEGIESTLALLQNQLKSCGGPAGIQIIRDYGQLPKVECYPALLNQAFMNILSNAIEALATQADPRYLTIRTQLWYDPEAGETAGATTPDAVIRIQDNGPGMNAEVKAQIFDPFFTTKPVGQGPGLGLSSSYQIVVQRHGGQLKCVSEPGQGAEFWIQIPLTLPKM